MNDDLKLYNKKTKLIKIISLSNQTHKNKNSY